MVSYRRAAALVLVVVVGVLVAASAFARVPHPGQTQYDVDVRPATEAEALDYSRDPLRFEDLGPNSKAAFLGALEAEDSEHVAWGERNAPEDFRLVRQYVVYQGEYYQVSLHTSDGLQEWLGLLLFLGLVGIGGVLAALGGVLYRRNSRTVAALALAILVVLGVVVLFFLPALGVRPPIPGFKVPSRPARSAPSASTPSRPSNSVGRAL